MVIGIDTSNYTTSVAILSADGELIANLKRPLPVKAGERGLRQSDAVFAHTVNIPELMREAGPLLENKKIILCMKGLEEDSGQRLTEIMESEGYDKNNLAVWVGPGHIQEFVLEKPNCMVIDGYNLELVRELVDTLKSPLIRLL